jgi:hypothetical protein
MSDIDGNYLIYNFMHFPNRTSPPKDCVTQIIELLENDETVVEVFRVLSVQKPNSISKNVRIKTFFSVNVVDLAQCDWPAAAGSTLNDPNAESVQVSRVIRRHY